MSSVNSPEVEYIDSAVFSDFKVCRELGLFRLVLYLYLKTVMYIYISLEELHS